ncbi:MAG: terminase large subunit [Fimbriimonadales bacterium]|nr:terminase large subunit [Fimbriimonadales bacterium]MDW8052648.1 terminase family protein [Armatimonadota bacterium]
MFAGWCPHPGQQAFLNATAPVRVLACGRRWGKTEVIAAEVARTLLTAAERCVLLVAPSNEQALLGFERTVEFLRRAGARPIVRRTPAPVLIVGNSRLWARSAIRGGVYLRGRKAHLIVVDEAAYVPEAVVNEVLMPMLADTGGKIALVSTPRGKNYFYRLYQQGQEDGVRIWSMRSPSWHNPLLSPTMLLMQSSLMSARQFQVEYGAMFLDAAEQVFRTEWVDRALLLNLPDEGLVVAGVDWARYRDYTALAVVRGSRAAAKLIALRRWQGLSWADQVQAVAEHLKMHQPVRVVCDRTGVGDPLLEALQAAGVPHAEGVVFTARVKQNLIENLALMLEQGRLQLLPDPHLLNELYHFEFAPASRGTQLHSGSVHDDLVIALALAVWALPNAEASAILTSGTKRT